MKKTVEIEYVGIEDVQDILDDAFALMREGHYVSVEVHSMSGTPKVDVYVMLGGWDANKTLDYAFRFYMTEGNTNIKEMNSCKVALKKLLVEE